MSNIAPVIPVFDPTSQTFPSIHQSSQKEERISALLQTIQEKTTPVDFTEIDFGSANIFHKYRFSIREDDPTPLSFYILQSGQGIVTDDAHSFALQVNDSKSIGHLISKLEYRGSQAELLENQLCQFCDGNEYEHTEIRNAPALRDTFWSHWKWNKDANIAYLFRIYPPCFAALESSLGPSSVVVEVCGGDGLFASQALKKLDSQIKSYYLVDRNQHSLLKAQQNLAPHIANDKASIVRADITQPFLEELPDNSVDCAIGIGALTTEVLGSKEEALAALRRLHQLLKPKGTLILSGYSFSYFSRKDLETEGFEVTNTFCPSKRQYIYVAQKKSPPPGDLFLEASLEVSTPIIEDYF